MSPFVCLKTPATRSTNPGGGSSAMNRRASLAAMKWAVLGWMESTSRTLSASIWPKGSIASPSTRLGVPATHAEGVELHELSGIVLVRRAFAVRLIVEVDEHRRRMGGGPQQLTEVAQRMTADYLPVINRLQKEAVALLDADVEVIRPELDHDLQELPAAVHLADQSRLA